MISINSAHLAAKFSVSLGIKECIFSGGFLDSHNVAENISWAFNLYSGNEATFI